MDTTNICLGNVYKSYPKLCNALKQKKKTNSNARLIHLEEIQRYVKLDIQGNTYTITEIYETPLAKVKKDKRKNNKGGSLSELYEPSEQILMHMLANAPIVDGTNRIVQLTRNKLFVNLGYVNENFNVANSNQSETSEILGVSPYATQEYFNKTYDKARQRVNALLRKMKNRHNLHYTLDVMVCDCEGTHRKPTQYEREFIVNAGRQTLMVMGLKDMTGVRMTRRFEEYCSRLNNLLKTIGLEYSYECYDIVISSNYVQQIQQEYSRQLENGETIDVLRAKINALSIESSNKTIETAFHKLLEYEPQEEEEHAHVQVLKDTFVGDSVLLSNVCGSINPKRNLKGEIALVKKNKEENQSKKKCK